MSWSIHQLEDGDIQYQEDEYSVLISEKTQGKYKLGIDHSAKGILQWLHFGLWLCGVLLHFHRNN